MGKTWFRTALFIMLMAGVGLRVALFWVNLPQNYFDNHLEPIRLILINGTIPAAYDCWQCYQPPVFYVTSVALSIIAAYLGMPQAFLAKFLQLLVCLFSVLNLGILLLIARRLPFADWVKLLVFGFFCFLPRDIYMAAVHSNDTLSYLLISLSAYFSIRIMEGEWKPQLLAGLALASAAAVLTKYTAFVVIPMAFSAMALGYMAGRIDRRQLLRGGVITLLVPTLVLGGYLMHNQEKYGHALPFNNLMYDAADKQPRDSQQADFTTFKPWQFIAVPILMPGQLSSFWTITYSSLWFDTEPKFIPVMGERLEWWRDYFSWVRGRNPFPGPPVAISRSVKLAGSALIAGGLIPLALGLLGCGLGGRRLLREWPKMPPASGQLVLYAVLSITTLAGIIKLVLNMPVFSAMKSSYLLGAMPAFGYFIGQGLMALDQKPLLRRAVIIALCSIYFIVVIHVLQILTRYSSPTS